MALGIFTSPLSRFGKCFATIHLDFDEYLLNIMMMVMIMMMMTMTTTGVIRARVNRVLKMTEKWG